MITAPAAPNQQVAPRITMVDVEHVGRLQSIAACVIESEAGLAVIDPGPTSALGTLREKLALAGASLADVSAVVLTHIHLDHAGATGTIVKENPRIRVSVHEQGAPHMIDPSRLLQSALRLYGAEMDRLWGEFLPVPAGNVQALAGGERIALGSRSLDVAYTPGHASHHVSLMDAQSGIAFVGDTAGIRIGNVSCITAPTPPPDIDLEQWRASLEKIRAWRPERLFLTHFGPADSLEWHLGTLEERLEEWSALVRDSLASGDDDDTCAARFTEQVLAQISRQVSEADAQRFAQTGGLPSCWYGLARYWRKRSGAPGA
ncbi:MAG: MBL fold metallo-hydrolase [Terriglobales bacterium]